MSEVMNLYQERLNRIFKTINLEVPDRVPVLSGIGTWASYYGGYSESETNWNVDKCREAIVQVTKDFPMDAVRTISVRPAGVYQALGSKAYNFLSDRNIVQYSDEHGVVMGVEEYPELIKDPFRFIVEKVLPRKYSELAKTAPARELAFARGAMHLGMFAGKIGGVIDTLKAECGMPVLFDARALSPLDWIADFFRGIKGSFLDIRRRPEEVEQAVQALAPLMVRSALGQLFSTPPKENPKVVFMPLHLPTMLKTQDFDKFYWPSFKMLVEALVSSGAIVLPFFEGDWSRYYDHLQELPAKKVVGLFEYGDAKVIKQKLGKTMCIAGLFPITLLQYGTKEDCIDKAKELIDALAPGGGYIFCTDKEIISPKDAKAENIYAVNQFVTEYGTLN